MKSGANVDNLSNRLIADILQHVRPRKHVSLVCRKWYHADRHLTRELQVSAIWSPPRDAIGPLAYRYSNLTTLQITYLRLNTIRRKQIDDEGLLYILSTCKNLTDLKLEGCKYVTTAGMTNIGRCSKLEAIRLINMPRVTGRGLFCLISGCPSLRLLHIRMLDRVLESADWLGLIGNKRQVESLKMEECREVGEMDLEFLGPKGWRNLREVTLSEACCGWDRIMGRDHDNWKLADSGGEECCPNLERMTLISSLSMSGTGML